MKKSVFNLDHQNSNIESKIVVSLERLSQAFRVLLWNESKAFALTPIQIQIMIFLYTHSAEKRKVSYLAEEFNLTKSTISDTIKTLEQKLLIKKEFEQTDTRSYIIHLTKKGKQLTEKISLFSQQIQIPIDQMNGDDKESLLLSLLNIIKHLNTSGVISVQRMCFNCNFYSASQNGKKHFCNLLKTKLADKDIRVDCPEHRTVEAV
jgi:DNA-binding MarR family transcriptional regulator